MKTTHEPGDETGTTDTFGVPILIGDSVRVVHWGTPVRLRDTGRTGVVLDVTHAKNIVVKTDGLRGNEWDDPIASGRAVRPGCLGVLRRDGDPDGTGDYEGNRTCTCGAREIEGCFCNLTPKQFYASPHIQKRQQRESGR